MASVRQWRGKWQVRWRKEAGGEGSRSFRLKRDAHAFASMVEVEKQRGAWIEPSETRLSLAEYSEQWLATKLDVAPRTLINIEGRLRNHVMPEFGRRPLVSIKPLEVQAWVAKLATKGLAPATVKPAFQCLSQMMETAERDRLIQRTPCVGIRLPAEVSGEEMRFLTAEEVDDLAAAIDDRYRALIYLGAYGGPRAGELAALRTDRLRPLPSRIDRIEVRESLSEVRGKLVRGPTKTRSVRTVRVPRFLGEMLANHVLAFPSESGDVFTSPTGSALRHRNFYQRPFGQAVASAGLGKVRFHDLRHTCAAFLIAQGASMEQVKRQLGHSSIRVTSDRYGHLFEGHDDGLMEALDRQAGGGRVDQAWTKAPVASLPNANQGAS